MFFSSSSLDLSGVRAGRSSPTLLEILYHKFGWPRMGNDADVHEIRYRSRTSNLTGPMSPIDESWNELRAYRGMCFPCPVSIAFFPLIVNCDRRRCSSLLNGGTRAGTGVGDGPYEAGSCGASGLAGVRVLSARRIFVR